MPECRGPAPVLIVHLDTDRLRCDQDGNQYQRQSHTCSEDIITEHAVTQWNRSCGDCSLRTTIVHCPPSFLPPLLRERRGQTAIHPENRTLRNAPHLGHKQTPALHREYGYEATPLRYL